MKKINKKEKEKLFTEADIDNLSQKELNKKGLKISETWLYKIFLRSSYKLLGKPIAVFRILKKSLAQLQRYESVREFSSDLKEYVSTLTRMVQAYVKGDYKGISKTNAALSLAALIYFVSPFDLIPDFLVIGFLDDLALLTWVYNNYRGEIEAFKDWEDDKKTRVELMPPTE
ncbi:MAG: DUF1232 domain-containing protein [Aureispira sp.]|nr:DUF1232 domain-containing protein [Aureispira sp.]